MTGDDPSPQSRWSVVVGLLTASAVTLAAVMWGVSSPGGFQPWHWIVVGYAALLAVAGLLGPRAGPPVLGILLSTGVTVAAVEICLHVFAPTRFAHNTLYRPDAELLFDYAPGAVKEFRWREAGRIHQTRVRINRSGCRGDDFPRSRDVGKLVIVFGDSNVAAHFSLLEDTFVERLARHLRLGLDEPVQAINAGCVAFGPDQASLKMERILAELKADIAIFCVFAHNDFGDLIRNKLFRLDDRGRLEPNEFTIAPAKWKALAAASTAPILYRAMIQTWDRIVGPDDHSEPTPRSVGTRGERRRRRLRSTTEKMLDCLAQSTAEYDEYVLEGDNRVHAFFNDSYDADIALTPNAASAIYKRDLMCGIVGRVAALGERYDVQIVLMVLPSWFDICRDRRELIDRKRFPEYDPRRLSSTVVECAEQHDLGCLNLWPVFEHGDPCALYDEMKSGHWNDRGQDVAAIAMADFLIGGLLAPPAVPTPR